MKCIEGEIPFQVPDGWEWCRISDVIDLYSGQDLEPSRYNYEGKGIPYITGASNLDNGKIIINRWTETPTTHSISGDLLLTCKGSGVGKMAFNSIEYCHIARQIMALRCKEAICKEYLKIVMSAFLKNITTQANGIIPGIRREIVLSQVISLPPLNEQVRISNYANEVIAIASSINTDKVELISCINLVKSKILDLAIQGKLVPQNPDDEPASALLERIRMEKEKLSKEGKIKRDKKESIIYRGDDNSFIISIRNYFNGFATIFIILHLPFHTLNLNYVLYNFYHFYSQFLQRLMSLKNYLWYHNEAILLKFHTPMLLQCFQYILHY